MKVYFSLAKNAVSSLSIALECFKKIYYKELLESEYEENTKIGIVFLENAIELLLKSILESDDELCIYNLEECGSVIQKAQELTNDELSLTDVLVQEHWNFKTIFYHQAVEKYCVNHESEKVRKVLNELGEYRNKITHFGIRVSSRVEVLRIFINAFDVIYNYLYPQLIKIDGLDDYFTSDDLIVRTIHGDKFLFDENMVYNNILDFLDEVLGDDNLYLFDLCRADSIYHIDSFEKYVNQALSDKSIRFVENKYNIKIERSGDEGIEFSVITESEENYILLRYLPFYNAGVYCNEWGDIVFIVLFSENKMYIYDDYVQYPSFDEPDIDRQWDKDESEGKCKSFQTSKNNILKALFRFCERELKLED